MSHARGATSPVWGTGITVLRSGESERVSLLKLSLEARWWSFSLWLRVSLPALRESTHSVQGECDEVWVGGWVCGFCVDESSGRRLLLLFPVTHAFPMSVTSTLSRTLSLTHTCTLHYIPNMNRPFFSPRYIHIHNFPKLQEI